MAYRRLSPKRQQHHLCYTLPRDKQVEGLNQDQYLTPTLGAAALLVHALPSISVTILTPSR